MAHKTFKILCIDGGGIKGLYSAQLLAKFEEVFGCVIVLICFVVLPLEVSSLLQHRSRFQ